MESPRQYTTLNNNYQFQWVPHWEYQDLQWKEKWGTPRCQVLPKFTFEWFWWVLTITWGSDEYWEQYLWLNNFYDGDKAKAEDMWPWTDMDDKSTWGKYE